MEIESRSTPVMPKKLWSMVKLVFYMLRKGIAKTKLLVDLHMKLKNGKLAWKAFTNLLLHHHHSAAFACVRSPNSVRMSSASRQEHAFDTPAAYSTSQCKSHHHPDDHNTIQQVSEVVNDGGAAVEASLAVVSHSRVADSPLQAEEESQVDKAAEEFINRFYKQLKQQRIASVESPSPHHLWA